MTELFSFLKKYQTFAKRNELISKCRHKNKYFLMNFDLGLLIDTIQINKACTYWNNDEWPTVLGYFLQACLQLLKAILVGIFPLNLLAIWELLPLMFSLDSHNHARCGQPFIVHLVMLSSIKTGTRCITCLDKAPFVQPLRRRIAEDYWSRSKMSDMPY